MGNTNEILLTFILDTVKSIDQKVDNLVTKEDCNEKQKNCSLKTKNEWTAKKITIIISGIIGAGGLITGIVKILN
jgi:hypothetical protein